MAGRAILMALLAVASAAAAPARSLTVLEITQPRNVSEIRVVFSTDYKVVRPLTYSGWRCNTWKCEIEVDPKHPGVYRLVLAAHTEREPVFLPRVRFFSR